VQVTGDSQPLTGASIRVAALVRISDSTGGATFRVAAGSHNVTVGRLGYAPDTVRIELAAGADTLLRIELAVAAANIERSVVYATRAERRLEDTPLRVEIIDEEEVAEKVAMTPGDIAMMLNETSGLRVQTTAPALGAASVRVHGLSGRYTLLLADGLPLYGSQAGGLGLLQIPPLDLARVEVIKGTASALYGGAALGGVVNLLSRRPGAESVREILLNQTSRGGSDAVLFAATSQRATSPWGATLLASGHVQRRNDIDDDGWADMPRYARLVLRPRLFYERPATNAFFTVGITSDDRTGGTLPGRVTPTGSAHVEALDTRRADFGVVARRLLAGRNVLSIRASGMSQRHEHQFGSVIERDRHTTASGEMTLALPRGAVTYVIGAAYAAETYRNRDVLDGVFDYDFRIPSLLGEVDIDAARWLSFSASARYDAHNEHGSMLAPRLSLLLRPGVWTLRLSGGGGTFAPVPFTDETDAVGLTPLRPLVGLRAERATYVAADVNRSFTTTLGDVEVSGTLHQSRVKYPLTARDAATAIPRIELVNAPVAARAAGGEVLARVVREPVRLTATYAYLRATEWDATSGRRRTVPLSPRHTAGFVGSVEEEESYRVGLEVYYTGRQALEHNPFRSHSRPYVIVGLLGERWISTRAGSARVFLNLENIGNVRQTRYDPLLLRFPGQGGRWTTDVWTELTGFTANAGVRFGFGG
jgi:iron complex outermembrane receptor protein